MPLLFYASINLAKWASPTWLILFWIIIIIPTRALEKKITKLKVYLYKLM